MESNFRKKIYEVGDVLARKWLSEEDFYTLINDGSIVVYICPVCKRLHIDEGGGVFNSYVREVPN